MVTIAFVRLLLQLVSSPRLLARVQVDITVITYEPPVRQLRPRLELLLILSVRMINHIMFFVIFLISNTIGNVYISDTGNHRVRKIAISTDIITTIAGTGFSGYNGDGGQATAANTQHPCNLNLDTSNNVYFGDYFAYNVIRKVDASTGIITTVAGTGSTSGGYNGDSIQATAATLNNPDDIVLDSYNNLYIIDRSNNRIRKVDVSTGTITTVVGTGDALSTGDGASATSASINSPTYGRFDSAGNLYISEGDGFRIRKVITVSTAIPTASPTANPR